jgi:hypothetical protein
MLTIKRYSPRIRIAGNPTASPKSADAAPAAKKATKNGTSSLMTSSADVYAPTP